MSLLGKLGNVLKVAVVLKFKNDDDAGGRYLITGTAVGYAGTSQILAEQVATAFILVGSTRIFCRRKDSMVKGLLAEGWDMPGVSVKAILRKLLDILCVLCSPLRPYGVLRHSHGRHGR